MPKYRLKIERTTAETSWLDVEADDEDAAIEVFSEAVDNSKEDELLSGPPVREWELEDTTYDVTDAEEIS
jgi:hypothetical protein